MTDRTSVPSISVPLLRFFRWIVRGYFRRHFHGVRVRHVEWFTNVKGPLVVYANHGSWWDPMVSILLADQCMRYRSHFAPMDELALKRYPVLRQVGVFGVELESARGAVSFLRTGSAVLAKGGVMWVTPQGRFVDARHRPLRFKPGLSALARRVASIHGRCTVLPLAIEYCFWDERTPECLLEFGRAIQVERGMKAGALEGRFESALEEAMDSLKGSAMNRDRGIFQTLAVGRRGTGGFYALGQRVKAFCLRRPYQPEHTAVQDGRTG